MDITLSAEKNEFPTVYFKDEEDLPEPDFLDVENSVCRVSISRNEMNDDFKKTCSVCIEPLNSKEGDQFFEIRVTKIDKDRLEVSYRSGGKNVVIKTPIKNALIKELKEIRESDDFVDFNPT